MAEDLLCFDLGFQFLNVEKDEKSDCQWDKISTEKTLRGLYTLVNKTEINFWQTQRRKPQKSSTTWAVKVFKGMKGRRKKITSLLTREITAN